MLRSFFGALFGRRPDPAWLAEEISRLERHAREAPPVVRHSYHLQLARLHLRAREPGLALRCYLAAIATLRKTGQDAVARAVCREVLTNKWALDRAAAGPGWPCGARELLRCIASAAHREDWPRFEEWIGSCRIPGRPAPRPEARKPMDVQVVGWR